MNSFSSLWILARGRRPRPPLQSLPLAQDERRGARTCVGMKLHHDCLCQS
jgi:hypothetical protein